MNLPEVDWIAFDGHRESTCSCRCGQNFRSHAKAFAMNDTIVVRTRRPCPRCARSDNCWRISSDPEQMDLA